MRCSKKEICGEFLEVIQDNVVNLQNAYLTCDQILLAGQKKSASGESKEG